jgi:hypothetical protein
MTDIDALVERLERHGIGHSAIYGHNGICGEAAQALTRLSEENARLREALTPILNYPGTREYVGSILYDDARAALQGDA